VSDELRMLGVSFRTAPVAVREALGFDRHAAADLLREVATASPGQGFALLSTCNRTEFYTSGPAVAAGVAAWMAAVRRRHPGAPILHADCHRYERAGSDAVRHLARVASGLDSAVLGDLQILGQVREAARRAEAAGSLDETLRRAFQAASRAGRRARSRTRIGHGAAGVGSALARTVVRHAVVRALPGAPRVLVLGAGELAREAAHQLAKQADADLVFVNRTWTRAREVADHCGGRALPWESLERELAAADVVVAATTAPEPVLGAATLAAAFRARAGRAWLVVDAGLPRNVEPTAGVELVDLDAIREDRERVLEARRGAVPEVERLVAAEVQDFEAWLRARPLEDALRSLYLRWDRMSGDAARELADAGCEKQARARVHRWVKRLLHDHVHEVRALWQAGHEPARHGG